MYAACDRVPSNSGVGAQLMQFSSASSASRASSTVGLLSIAAICTGCIVGWVLERHVGYLVAAAGALVVAPIWFEAPPRFSERLRFARGPLSKTSVVLALVGYPLILAGVAMRLMA